MREKTNNYCKIGDLVEFTDDNGPDVRNTFGIYLGSSGDFYDRIYSQALGVILECMLPREYEKVNL